MRTNRSQIKIISELVEELIMSLQGELPESERQLGWTPENQEIWLEFFVVLKDILANEDFRAHPHFEAYKMLTYHMDRSGILGGELMNTASTINLLIRGLGRLGIAWFG